MQVNSTFIEKPTSAFVSSNTFPSNSVAGKYKYGQFLNYNVSTPAPGNTVSSVNVTAEGSGYSTPPKVVFTGGGGSGADADAILGFGIAGIVVDFGGSYASMPTIVATVGTGATFAPSMQALAISSIGAAGSGYQPGQLLTVSGGTSTTVATVTSVSVLMVSASISNAGTGYAVNDTITLNSQSVTHPVVKVTSIGAGGSITAFTITNGGEFGTTQTSLSQLSTSGSGTGATFNNISYGVHTLATVTRGVYSALPANPVTITGGSGTGLTANLLWSIIGASVTTAGQDYDSTATWSTTGGGGTGGTGTFTLNSTGGVKQVVVTNGGSNYTGAPTVSFSGGGGSSAAATAVVTVSGDVIVEFILNLLTPNYTIVATPNQPCVVTYSNKTQEGFSVYLTPMTGHNLIAGSMDVSVEILT